MKRTILRKQQKQRIEVVVPLYQILPPELWPSILAYLTVWQRLQCLTVCKAWSEPRGLIDQSIQSLNSRRDSMPIYFSRLANLVELEAPYREQLAITIQCGYLRNLEFLNLLYCAPRYSADISAISLLTNLRSLKLDTNLTNYEEVLPRLTSLTQLSLDCSEVYSSRISDTTLISLTGLTDLTLDCTAVTDDALIKLTTLRYLSLRNNKCISGMGGIAHLTQLRSLALIGNKSTSSGALFRLTGLTHLSLDENRKLFNNDIRHLTLLNSLCLSDNRHITSDILSSFPLLTRLIMCDYPYGDNGLHDTRLKENITKLTQLRELAFSGEEEWFLPCECLSSLTQLTSLSIEESYYVRSESLSCLTNLRRLRLTNTPFLDFDANALPVSLERLDLTGCTGWYERTPTLCTRLTNLKEFSLGRMHTGSHEVYPTCERLNSLLSLERIYYQTEPGILAHLFYSHLKRSSKRIQIIQY